MCKSIKKKKKLITNQRKYQIKEFLFFFYQQTFKLYKEKWSDK